MAASLNTCQILRYGHAMANYLLALDIGTSASHCLLTDHSGNPIDSLSAPMSYYIPEGCSSLAKEFNPETVLHTVGGLISWLLKRRQLQSRDIAAIGITSQRQGVVFLDAKGKELYCSPNVDLRAVFEGGVIDETLGQEVYDTTGHFPSFLLAPARLRWLRENQPQECQRVSSVLTVAGWMAYRLTGNQACEPTLDGEAGLLDIAERERCTSLLNNLEVSTSLLPPLTPAGSVVGRVTTRIAAQWGLRPGIPVTIAGPDTQCGLLGMGLISEGQSGAVMGWSCPLQVLTTQPYLDQQMRTWAGCYLTDSLWVVESNIGDAGYAYQWLKETTVGESTSFEDADHLARQAPPGCDGVMALLGPSAKSAFKKGLGWGGILFPTPLSFQTVAPAQLLRAGLENIAFSIKANLATLEEITGTSTGTLHIGGGMARSRVLAAALANVLGIQVKRSVLHPQVSARGAALAAAVAFGTFDNLTESVRGVDESYELIDPDSSLSAEYQEYYEQWRTASQRLEDLNQE